MSQSPPIPRNATIAEAVASIRTGKTVDELRLEKAAISHDSSRQNQFAKMLVASKPTDIDRVAEAMSQ